MENGGGNNIVPIPIHIYNMLIVTYHDIRVCRLILWYAYLALITIEKRLAQTNHKANNERMTAVSLFSNFVLAKVRSARFVLDPKNET